MSFVQKINLFALSSHRVLLYLGLLLNFAWRVGSVSGGPAVFTASVRL